MEEPQLIPQILSPSTTGTRKSSDSNSPEFEFWMIRNPSFPQPNLLSADQLFSDGFLLPLHLLNLSNDAPQPHEPEPSGSDQVQENEDSTIESAKLSAAGTPSLTSSKRWMDIFKRSDKKSSRSSKNVNGVDDSCKVKDINNNGKEKKREKKNGVGASNGVSVAELNINIWPFSRSRSAGNGGTRPRSGATTRKVSSAPCSRSNSAGESKSRKWPSSPSRAGVHIGRSSPVWQVRRSGAGGGGGSSRSSDTYILKNAQKGVRNDGNEGRRKTPAFSSTGSSKPRVLSLNVPTCIGYRHHLSCRSDENNAAGVAAGSGSGVGNGDVSGEGIRGSNLFNIRSLFTKKVY